MIQSVSPIVSAAWLREKIVATDVTVIDGTTFTPGTGLSAPLAHLEERLPGAVFFDIDRIARDLPGPPNRMLPAPEEMAEFLSELGLNHGNHFVVYDSHGLYSAARVWWMLRMHGYERVSVLDGGLPAWKAAGGALERGPVSPRARSVWPVGRIGPWVRDWLQVLHAVETGGETVVDVRPAAQFNGDTSQSYPGVRPGHIAGAVNLSQRDIRHPDGRFLPEAEIRGILAAKGLSPEDPIAVSCGSGVTACILSLALAMIRGEPAPVYDGSWEEWGMRDDLPVELDPGGAKL